jgi:hypothetical protein
MYPTKIGNCSHLKYRFSVADFGHSSFYSGPDYRKKEPLMQACKNFCPTERWLSGIFPHYWATSIRQ